MDKLPDSEIVKALEEYAAKYNLTYIGKQAKIILDLINRLQAENERLQRRNHFLEIEYKNQGDLFWARVETAKAEAYKDCIEKVKKKYQIFENQAYAINPYALHGFLDNLLKELVGEE